MISLVVTAAPHAAASTLTRQRIGIADDVSQTVDGLSRPRPTASQPDIFLLRQATSAATAQWLDNPCSDPDLAAMTPAILDKDGQSTYSLRHMAEISPADVLYTCRNKVAITAATIALVTWPTVRLRPRSLPTFAPWSARVTARPAPPPSAIGPK